ncbi:hypothetical protein [Streptomyces sp. NPDC047014]|uniref:hypothetical protein n=1 Tax=Streptomyces sp. NPDC047014 TaxID=3155736 RepID=UPI0033EDCADE
MAPNESVTGRRAVFTLAFLRKDWSSALREHPAHTFQPLPDVLAAWEGEGIDAGVFHKGVEEARHRFTGYGLAEMLPFERVAVACRSSRSGAFGGFHHPDQGYRHLQMVSVLTMYGPMGQPVPERPTFALLDLLRAYVHDCLHYGSRRRYVDVAGEVVRTQYGINFRRPGGRSYSAADSEDSAHTRNLGVVMEGACDREARAVTRLTAARWGVAEPADAFGALAYRDVTGTLAEADIGAGAEVLTGCAEKVRYAEALRGYESGVGRRYAGFLGEFAPGEEDWCHALIVGAIISGDVAPLGAWLDDRHGPGAFAGLFRAADYFAPDGRA